MSFKSITEIQDECRKVILEEFGYTEKELIKILVNMNSKTIFIDIWDKSSYKGDAKYISEREFKIARKILDITGFETTVSI